jgi:hypothetical protein
MCVSVNIAYLLSYQFLAFSLPQHHFAGGQKIVAALPSLALTEKPSNSPLTSNAGEAMMIIGV